MTLVYDASCTLCVRALLMLRHFDRESRLRFVDGNDRDAVEREFPQLRAVDFDAAMYAVDGVKTHRGFEAFRAAMALLPATRPLSAVFALPGAAPMGTFLYERIACNRHAFQFATPASGEALSG